MEHFSWLNKNRVFVLGPVPLFAPTYMAPYESHKSQMCNYRRSHFLEILKEGHQRSHGRAQVRVKVGSKHQSFDLVADTGSDNCGLAMGFSLFAEEVCHFLGLV